MRCDVTDVRVVAVAVAGAVALVAAVAVVAGGVAAAVEAEEGGAVETAWRWGSPQLD